MISIRTELKEWLVNYVISFVKDCKSEDSQEFNDWVKSLKNEDVISVVEVEFINDWGYDKRDAISEEEAIKYAQSLIQKILSTWCL